MTSVVDELVNILDLETLAPTRFRGVSPQVGWQRVFGGQVVAQALVAACRTVDDRAPHSLHAYFLLGGDPKVPIAYEVERLRDGRSFATRRVVAAQHGHAIFALSASFQRDEGGFEHAAAMPDVPAPEDLPGDGETRAAFLDRLPPPARAYYARPRPIDLRPVDLARYTEARPHPPAFRLWFRAAGRLPDTPALHRAVLAYASDFTLLDTALAAHGRSVFNGDIQAASLDHALWFHRPFRADEWLLYVQDSPSASGGRGIARGTIFSRDGRLVASVVQEGVIRARRSEPTPA